MKKLLHASTLLAAFALAGPSYAQDIQVSSGNFTDMTSAPSLNQINGNDYGPVLTTGFKIYAFDIFNHDPDTNLTVGDITITGANADQFDVYSDYDNVVLPFSQTTVYIEADPTSIGTKNATVNIPNNDPDLGGTLSFPIRTTGAVAILTQPNIRVYGVTQPKLKFVKQSNSDYIMSGTFYIVNDTLAPVENIEVNIYSSFNRMYQQSDQLKDTFIVPKIAASKEGKTPKQKKVKFSFQFTFTEQADVPRYLFIEALPQAGDSHTAGNRTRMKGIDPLDL